MWVETPSGMFVFKNDLNVMVLIYARESESRPWRYRVAMELRTLDAGTSLDDVKMAALCVLRKGLVVLLSDVVPKFRAVL